MFSESDKDGGGNDNAGYDVNDTEDGDDDEDRGDNKSTFGGGVENGNDESTQSMMKFDDESEAELTTNSPNSVLSVFLKNDDNKPKKKKSIPTSVCFKDCDVGEIMIMNTVSTLRRVISGNWSN